jgi:hypothetical protein
VEQTHQQRSHPHESDRQKTNLKRALYYTGERADDEMILRK